MLTRDRGSFADPFAPGPDRLGTGDVPAAQVYAEGKGLFMLCWKLKFGIFITMF